MKKILICLLVIAFGLPMFACRGTEKTDAIRIYVPDGAPALAIAKLMHDGEKIGGKEFEFIVVDPSTITTYLTAANSPEFAILPTNAAANLYNKSKDYNLAATVTHGNLYILGKNDVEGATITEKLNALKGKKIGVIGQGNVPDMTFKYIMNNYDITDDITVSYYDNGGEAIGALKLGVVEFILIGEPAVETAIANASAKIAFDLCDIWEDITGERLYPQAGLVAKSGIDNTLVNALVAKMKEGEAWAEQNPTDALNAISANMLKGTATSIKDLNQAIVKRCNIKIITANEGKEAVINYLEAIMSINANAIGGKLPEDAFYL